MALSVSPSSSLRLYAAVGLGAAALIGYCVYFDRQRRSAPDFRAKLRARRKRAARHAQQHRGPKMPDFADQEDVQRFFLQEVSMRLLCM
jgi:import receptor subunit TOM20